ncbi:InlB B-repeat-containing protein [Bifidobacterium sp. B4142]|nr:InlB B-repeat-containing protein [Bifidobacterium sp. B4142]
MQASQSSDKPWTVVGWTYSVMGPDTVDFTKPFTADTTVFAKWDQANAITFIAQDPTNLDHEPATQTLYTGEGHKLAVQPGAPANYPGYTFEGWFSADSNAAFNPEAVFSEDATFVAKYTLLSLLRPTRLAAPRNLPRPATRPPTKQPTRPPTKQPARPPPRIRLSRLPRPTTLWPRPALMLWPLWPLPLASA